MDILILLLCFVSLCLNFINFIILRDLLDTSLEHTEYEDEDDFLDFKER